jgi:anti-sigma regulatory factor (Ser/Thr protein kinase)
VDLRDHLSFLSEATAAIGAGPDMAAIAARFAAALVPRLGDDARVYLLDALFADGAPAPAGPRLAAAGPLRRVAPGGAVELMSVTDPCYEAMATGEPVCVPKLDPDGRPCLAMPLLARGRVFGCVALSRSPGRAPFDEVDVLTVGQLAAQTALGVDNARLYRGQAAIAAEVKRSIPPITPPTLTGIQIAHRYLPGDPAVEAGGDWFDTIALPGSRIAIVIGDVLGHGVRAMAVTGHLRAAVQTLAALDLPPDQLLRQLDNLAQRLGDDHLATCLYAVYDPVARVCTFANAGHLPPILVRPNGSAERVAIPTGAPIGVGGVAFDTAEISIRDGDTLVFYTDGLVQGRPGDIEERLTELAECLTAPELAIRGPETMCDALVDGLRRDRDDRRGGDRGGGDRGWGRGGRHGDDVALLAARLSGIPAENVAYWLLAPLPQTVARARRLIKESLVAWGLTELADMAELLATELITNAIRYASRPIELRLLRTRSLVCEIRDDDLYLPVLRQAADLDEDGRGLFLVSRLARRWGVSRTTHGKVVWFELAL